MNWQIVGKALMISRMGLVLSVAENVVVLFDIKATGPLTDLHDQTMPSDCSMLSDDLMALWDNHA